MTQILSDISTKKYILVKSVSLLQFYQIMCIICHCFITQPIKCLITVHTSRIYVQDMSLYHFIQVSLDRRLTYRWIATFLFISSSYYAIELSERLFYGNIKPFRIFNRHQQKQSKVLVNVMHLFFHHIVNYDTIVNVLVSISVSAVLKVLRLVSHCCYLSHLFPCVLLKISLLRLYNFFIFSMSSKSKLIAVSEKTYHDLAEMGTLEDSFNSVIERMIQKQKAAASGLTLAGTGQNAATALQSTTKRGSRKQ